MRLALLAGLLLAASAARAQGGWPSVSGRVVDAETGAPIDGARVDYLWCRAVDQTETCTPMNGDGRQTVYSPVTGPTGTFRVATIVELVYAVRARRAGYCEATTPPFDELARHRLIARLSERLNAPIAQQAALTESQRQLLYEEQDHLVREVLPVPHVEIALRRPPCAAG